MELMTKQGYKQTEVGLIPEDWKVSQFENLFKVIGGGTFKSRDRVKDGTKWLKIANVGVRKTKWDEIDYLPNSFLKLYADFVLYENDVVMALTRPILSNKLKITKIKDKDSPCLLNQRVGKIEVNLNVHLEWVYHLLQSHKSIMGLLDSMAGTDPPNLSNKGIYSIKVATPPTLTEQKAIATALSDVDALITSLEQTITKKKAIKQGAMQQLLTPPHKGGKRLPGFEGEWVEKTLGDIGDCIRGVSYNGSSDLYPFDNNNSIRLLRSNNVYDKKIVFQDLQYVKKKKVNSHQIIQPKDILICMANGSKALVGKAGQFNGANMKYTFGAFMGILRPNIDECDGDFIFNLFSTNSFRCHLDIQLSGSSINNLKPSDIEDFKFYSPNYPEQQAIAQILSDMDAEITQLETKKEKYQAIKQGMMQELLTGKTRLV